MAIFKILADLSTFNLLQEDNEVKTMMIINNFLIFLF